MTRRVRSDGSDFQKCCDSKNAMMKCWKELSENQVVVCCCEFLHVYIHRLIHLLELHWAKQACEQFRTELTTALAELHCRKSDSVFPWLFPWLFPKKKPTNLFNKNLCLGFGPVSAT